MASVVHLCPSGTVGTTECCGRTVFSLPRGDRITLSKELVNCDNPMSTLKKIRFLLDKCDELLKDAEEGGLHGHDLNIYEASIRATKMREIRAVVDFDE